jgi:nucleoside-diphosphate-sugar epimerase
MQAASLSTAARNYSHAVTEDDPILPTTVYGATKAMNEVSAAHYGKVYGLRTVGLRPHFSFGPGRYDGAAGQFASMIKACATGHPTEWRRVFTKGAVLAPIHARDMAAAFAHAVSGPELPRAVYNVGGREALTEDQMVDVVVKLTDNHGMKDVSAGDAYGLDFAEVDCSAFPRDSGFQQQYDFEGAVRASISAYRPA